MTRWRSAALRLGFARYGDRVGTLAADLTSAADRQRICSDAAGWRGGVNVLVNNAGINHFRMFEDQPPEQLDLALAINVQAPIHLCHGLLPHLRRQPEACILNTGSVFGAIGYPGYAVYSATKFAMRGFTEALRRELADTSVHVHYVAPRATRTGINTSAVERMNARARGRDGPAGTGGEGGLRHAGRWPRRGRARLAGEVLRPR